MSSQRVAVKAEKGIHLPIFSQAIKYGGMVYVSGNVGMDYPTMKLADGGIMEQTRKTIENMKLVLEEGGSSLDNLVKVRKFCIGCGYHRTKLIRCTGQCIPDYDGELRGYEQGLYD